MWILINIRLAKNQACIVHILTSSNKNSLEAPRIHIVLIPCLVIRGRWGGGDPRAPTVARDASERSILVELGLNLTQPEQNLGDSQSIIPVNQVMYSYVSQLQSRKTNQISHT